MASRTEQKTNSNIVFPCNISEKSVNDKDAAQYVEPENVLNSRYFDIDEIQALKLHDKD